jgi:hypothetical protein
MFSPCKKADNTSLKGFKQVLAFVLKGSVTRQQVVICKKAIFV